jgi:bifunctional DNase/RNase
VTQKRDFKPMRADAQWFCDGIKRDIECAKVPRTGSLARSALYLNSVSDKLSLLILFREVGVWKTRGDPMEIEMKIRGLMMDPVTNVPIVILKGVEGSALLPIWVGVYEANAIAVEIEKVTTPRPMTHDLIKNVLTGLECSVNKVVVNQLKDDTFYAIIWLEREGKLISIDSRPSDALALALRTDSPIFVDEEVIKTSKSSPAKQEKMGDDELKRWLENLNDEDLGKYKM